MIAHLPGRSLSRFFISVKLFYSAVSLTHQFFMVFSINFMTPPDILYILVDTNFSHDLTTDFYTGVRVTASLFRCPRFFPSILADFNSAVIWMISILPLISNSSGLLSKLFESVPRAQTIIAISVTFIIFLQGFCTICDRWFSLNSKWRQVKFALHDSSKNSNRSHQWCGLHGFNPFTNLLFPVLFFRLFGIVSRIFVIFMFQSFFCSLARS